MYNNKRKLGNYPLHAYNLNMLDWRFNEYEGLPLLVTLLLDSETSRSEAMLDQIYRADPTEISASLCQNPKHFPHVENIMAAILNDEMLTATSYEKGQIRSDNLARILIEPVSFFRWAEKQGYELTYSVEQCVESRENEHRVQNYADYKFSKSQLAEKLNEPLWNKYDAVMYLFGFEPSDKDFPIFGNKLSFEIIHSQKKFKQLLKHLENAEKVGDIKLYSGGSFNEQVRPKDFMNWAKGLGMEFPNLIHDVEKPDKTEFRTKERNTLLKMIIGMAKDAYGFDPTASRSPFPKELEGILDGLGISISDDTIRKWLKEAADHLPPDNDTN